MLVRTPLMQTQQNGSVRVDDLPEVSVRGLCRGEPEQRLIPVEARRHVFHTDDRPRPSHRIPTQKNTYDRTTTFFRQRAFSGAVGSMHAEWNDQRDTEPSVPES